MFGSRSFSQTRAPRLPTLPWANVFIPADVLGSNMANDDDESTPTEENEVKIGNFKPTTTWQYTSETLTWGHTQASRIP